jgi:hypothetical protein
MAVRTCRVCGFDFVVRYSGLAVRVNGVTAANRKTLNGLVSPSLIFAPPLRKALPKWML